MVFASCSFGMTHPVITGMRRKALSMEDMLSDHFMNFNILPVPDEAPQEIPRLMTSSRSGHSNLVVCGNNTTVTTNFDGEFTSDWTRAADYVHKKAIDIMNALQSVYSISPYYVGLTTQLFIDDPDPLHKITDSISGMNKEGLYDTNIRNAYTCDDKYYINITIANARFFVEQHDPAKPPKIDETNPQKIGITIDINDRYGYNTIVDHKTDMTDIEWIISKTTSIISQSPDNLLRFGLGEA